MEMKKGKELKIWIGIDLEWNGIEIRVDWKFVEWECGGVELKSGGMEMELQYSGMELKHVWNGIGIFWN